MRRSSWIALSVCGLLIVALGLLYWLGRRGPEDLTPEAAQRMIATMQRAVAAKNVGAIMQYMDTSPSSRIANLRPDQLRLLLARGFRGSGRLNALVTNVNFGGGHNEASVDFDLVVQDTAQGMVADDYSGHITFHLRRMAVSHALGLYHTQEWIIVSAETTGKDPSTFGDD